MREKTDQRQFEDEFGRLLKQRMGNGPLLDLWRITAKWEKRLAVITTSQEREKSASAATPDGVGAHQATGDISRVMVKLNFEEPLSCSPLFKVTIMH